MYATVSLREDNSNVNSKKQQFNVTQQSSEKLSCQCIKTDISEAR